MKKRLFAGLIVLVLLLSVASAGAMAANKEPVAFSQMKYTRPDAKGIIQFMNDLGDNLDTISDMAALEEALDTVMFNISEFNTMYVLAVIYSGKDMRVQIWLDELDYLASWSPQIDEALMKLYRALPDCKFADEIEAEMGSDYMEELRNLHVPGKAEVEIQKRILWINDQYDAKLSTATVNYKGKTYTFNQIMMLDDYDEYFEALVKWFEENSEQFSRLYISQIKLRQLLATTLGYKNVIEMEFEAFDYTPKMVDDMLSALATELEPVTPLIELKGALGYNTEVSVSEFTNFQKAVYPRISRGLSNALDVMHKYGLYDFDMGAYKTTAQYTTYFEDYGLPFIMISYQRDLNSMTTLNHEFGHFYNFYSTEGMTSTMDVSEVHSHALELLASNHYAGYYGRAAGKAMQHDVLYRIFSIVRKSAMLSDMELRLYSMDPDNLTPKKIRQIAADCAEAYGFKDDYYAYSWILDSQLVTTPFYMVGYASSAAVSMQIWELSKHDASAAVKAYERFIHLEEGDSFLSLIKDTGLDSPFNPATMKELAVLFEESLLTAADRRAIDAITNLADMIGEVA